MFVHQIIKLMARLKGMSNSALKLFALLEGFSNSAYFETQLIQLITYTNTPFNTLSILKLAFNEQTGEWSHENKYYLAMVLASK